MKIKLKKSDFIKSDDDLDYVRYVSYLEKENQELIEYFLKIIKNVGINEFCKQARSLNK